MPSPTQWASSKARQILYATLRGALAQLGYCEVETPLLVPAPGMEPHINPFSVRYLPETEVGSARELWLHTSPEYAMKRLLADGCEPIFQLCKVFRNGEISATHNPEFTLLELYRPQADYRAIMADLEVSLAAAEASVAPQRELFSRVPYERITVREAVLRETGIDLRAHPTAASLQQAAERAGVRVGASSSYVDVFFHLFLQKVESSLGRGRPTFLLEYPASMAALARLKPTDPSVAERVELYAEGLELGNGFSELTDSIEQRSRLEAEQRQRASAGKPVLPVDERFLAALSRMPPSGGIAVGLDRVLMLLTGASSIDEVLLFPARGFFE